jgi:hypothetical protein
MNEYLALASMRHRLKYVMMYCLPSVTCINTTPITISSTTMYNQNGIPAIGAFIPDGEDRYFLMSSKARY